ncbi:DNA-3-methyladenine glycosylase [Halopseudomonas nanhaiensis]|uniref:DNA-3-methyladenine glycosylase n=1 Tax=Halopseudomonas nanhaiensis TaxID=2830842 RepID=UPI001CBF205D|nr:DNA-3-methyladenine glycosylase [Halopseudomonas nanhaiensis]UAW99166.1 DNA-3-methyladenine glycosylase [Halopseudomonas nanhaiensis]
MLQRPLPWPSARPLPDSFFDRDARQVAIDLLGKVLRRKHGDMWLSARIIETEAYMLDERGSHASLGYTHNRRALFAGGGTIYMYYARGGDSLNFSAAGPGNSVLIKSAFPHVDVVSGADSVRTMQQLNPARDGEPRPIEKLCAGQTLLCKALDLKVPHWNAQGFDPAVFFVDDAGECPSQIIQTTRLGIPPGRDEHLPYRFVDAAHARHCTKSPLGRTRLEGNHYHLLGGGAPWKEA